jgi:hypothetical protein
MILATIVLFIAIAWPMIEPVAIAAVRALTG